MKFPIWGGFGRILRLALPLSCLALSPCVFAAPLEVTGLNLHEGHLGGTHHLYLSVQDDGTGIETSKLLLKAGDQWLTPESVSKRSAHTPLDLVLLIQSGLLQSKEAAKAIESQVRELQGLTDPSAQIRLTRDGVALSTTWDGFTESSPGETSDQVSVVQAVHAISGQWTETRRRVIFWVSGSTGLNLDTKAWTALQNLLIRKQTTLFVFSSTEPDPAGIPALAVTGGRFLRSSAEGSLIKDTALRILGEHEVTFSSQGLGWIPQKFEILMIGEPGLGSASWRVPDRQIWKRAIDDWPVYGVGSVFLGGVLILVIVRLRRLRPSRSEEPYFELISPRVRVRKFPIPEKNAAMSFLEPVAAAERLRLPGNVSRVWLRRGEDDLLLEDNNYKNALLVNRRRTKRRVLKHDDILDMGEVVLRFVSPHATSTSTSRATSFNSLNFRSSDPEKPRGPLRKDTLVLTIGGRKGFFPITKNLFFIGESQINDLVIKGEDTYPKHVKIQKVGSLYKLVNLANPESTLVNGRRVSQKLLRNGDDLQLGNVRLQISIGLPQKEGSQQTVRKPLKTNS